MKLFKKGKPFESEIKILTNHLDKSRVNLFVNNEYQSDYSTNTFISPRMINRISVRKYSKNFYVLLILTYHCWNQTK